MKLKPLIITVFIIGILAAIGWKLTRPAPRVQEPDSLAGEKLLQPDLLEKAEEIILQKPSEEESVTLKKEKGGDWILPDYHGFRADFSKLKTLTGNLLDASILRLVTRSAERIERLELGENQITLKSAEGSLLWDLETGKRGPSTGLFIRLDGQDEAYLADLSLYLDTNIKSWADKKLLTFEQKEVSRVRLEFSDTGQAPLDISRAEPEGPFEISGPVEGETVKQEEITSLISTLLNARFNDVHSPDEEDAEGARQNSRDIVLGLFNGDSYTLSIGRRPAEAIEVEEVEEGEEDEEKEDEEEPEPGPVFIFYKSSEPDNYLNRIMPEAALVFSDYTFNQLPENREKLVEVKVEPVVEEEENQESSE